MSESQSYGSGQASNRSIFCQWFRLSRSWRWLNHSRSGGRVRPHSFQKCEPWSVWRFTTSIIFRCCKVPDNPLLEVHAMYPNIACHAITVGGAQKVRPLTGKCSDQAIGSGAKYRHIGSPNLAEDWIEGKQHYLICVYNYLYFFFLVMNIACKI